MYSSFPHLCISCCILIFWQQPTLPDAESAFLHFLTLKPLQTLPDRSQGVGTQDIEVCHIQKP